MRNRGRALIKFLWLWIRYSNTDHRPTTVPTIELTPSNLQFTYKPPRGRRRGTGGGSAAKTAGGQGSSRSSSSSSKKKANSCVTTTVLLSEALGVFTKLFVLCRRCRRPCTTLFANQDDANNVAQNGTGGKESAGRAAAVIPEVRGRGVTLWVECQGDGCGWRSGMSVAAGGGGSTAPPPWLVKFARYVQSRGWKVRYCKRREYMCLCVVPLLISWRLAVGAVSSSTLRFASDRFRGPNPISVWLVPPRFRVGVRFSCDSSPHLSLSSLPILRSSVTPNYGGWQ